MPYRKKETKSITEKVQAFLDETLGVSIEDIDKATTWDRKNQSFSFDMEALDLEEISDAEEGSEQKESQETSNQKTEESEEKSDGEVIEMKRTKMGEALDKNSEPSIKDPSKMSNREWMQNREKMALELSGNTKEAVNA